MTARDITRMAFECQYPPRVPVTLIGGGSFYVHMAGETFAGIKDDPKKIADVFIQAFRKIGHDLMWSGSNFINYPIHCLGCPIKDDTSDNPALVGTVIRSLEERHSLDADKALKDPIMQTILESHHIVADTIGKETMLTPTHWGPLTTAARIVGTEPVMMAMVTDPESLLELIEFSMELIWSIAELIVTHPEVSGINIAEPLASGDMISSHNFRTFAKPFLKELLDRAAAKGKYSMVHICGDTTGILEDILEIRPNCYSLESKVDLGKAKSVLGGRVCVAGNVDPTGAFLSGTPEEVIAEGKACIDSCGAGGGYMLTLGCDFPKNVPLENVMAFMSLKSA
jgi:uroporphyrinogen decarboxylase